MLSNSWGTARKHVLEASYEGFKAAIPASLSDVFMWHEMANGAPSLLFLGTHQVLSCGLSQDTWFEFDPSLQSVTYVIRLTNADSSLPLYGNRRGLLEAKLALEEAAGLLDMCISQALAAGPLISTTSTPG